MIELHEDWLFVNEMMMKKINDFAAKIEVKMKNTRKALQFVHCDEKLTLL